MSVKEPPQRRTTDGGPGQRQSLDPDVPLLRWVWRDYLYPQRLWLTLALILMAIEGSMLGALSYMIQPMFDDVFVEGNRGALFWVAMAVGAIFVIRGFSAFGHKLMMRGAGLRIIAAMQKDMVQHLLTLDSPYFQKNSPGTLIERVRGDTAAANNVWAVLLSAGVRDVFSIVALLAVAISIDWRWTLVAVAAAPLLLAPIFMLHKYVRKKATAARQAAGVLSTRLDEIFHGVNTIKLNTSETREVDRFGGSVDTYLDLELKSRVGQAGIGLLPDLVSAAAFVSVLLYGGNQIIDGDKTVGEFMSFFTAIGLLFEPVRRIANVSAAWQAARANLERIREVFLAAPVIVSPARPKAMPAKPQDADIVLDGVSVVYDGEKALNGASFTAKAGQTTALVGASGAGKSTIFNVLTRLIDPDEGRALIGGVPTSEMGLPELRALYSVVTQDAPMFDESLRDNIELSTRDVTDARMADALEAAHLTDFVSGLPAGLATQAGPRGSQLSGGQKQRVAIARAVLRDAPILLLDEATSALDAESERHVQEALDTLSRQRTTLVIAHRLSTVRRADKIVVMDKGRVLDEGTHDELLERGGVYARLYELQFRET